MAFDIRNLGDVLEAAQTLSGLEGGPQAHIAAAADASAQTSDAVAATDATSPAGVGYVQADQTALADLANETKGEVNALVTDVASLYTGLAALAAVTSTLLTELQAAGLLAKAS